MKKNNEKQFSELVIILIIIIILILFLATLGNIRSGLIPNIPEEYKDSKEEAKRKHKRLEEHIKNQESLKIKLEKTFKHVYFGVRIGLVFIWFGLMSILIGFDYIKTPGDFLNYSEASILVLIVLNFITFGTLTNLKNYIDIIKTKTENMVYGKYITIDQKIELNKTELKIIEDTIKLPLIETMTIQQYIDQGFKFYHITPAINIPSIISNGLENRNERGICVVRSEHDLVIKYICETMLVESNVQEYAVLEILPFEHLLKAEEIEPDNVVEFTNPLHNYIRRDILILKKESVVKTYTRLPFRISNLKEVEDQILNSGLLIKLGYQNY